MSTTIAAPSRIVIPIDAGQVITIAPGATGAGRYGRLGDQPGSGETPTSYSALAAAGVSVLVGPFIVATRIVVECTAGTVSYTVSTPNPAYCVLLGKIEGFTGNVTLSLDGNGRLFRCDDASNVTVTVPNFLPEGFNVAFAQWGAGTVTFSAASGATKRSTASAISAQYDIGSLLVMKNSDGASAEFLLGGNVS